MNRNKQKKAFTLIELLVVIAIIALLMAVIIPSLKKAKELAKKAICKSNLHQLALSMGSYESQFNFNFRTNDKWYFYNGTCDMPYEVISNPPSASYKAGDSPYYASDLMRNKMLPDRKVFFCPAVRGISHEKNYRYDLAAGGNTTIYSVADMEWQRETGAFTGNQRPAFWSTYAWLWKKGRSGSDVGSVNNASSGALLCDVPDSAWQYAINLNNGTDATMLKAVFGANGGAVQTLAHGNVLMKDLSINNPADKDEDFNLWLWNDTRWAGK